MFDPHCRYISGSENLCPGRRYDVDSDFWTNMSDLQCAYLLDRLPNHPFYLRGGSLFWFPLRSKKEQIMNSETLEHKVSSEPITPVVMKENLKNWIPQIEDALLFLNHITQFDFYVISN